MEAGIEAKT